MELDVHNVNATYIKYMMEAEPMTVGELIKKLERMPKKAPHTSEAFGLMRSIEGRV